MLRSGVVLCLLASLLAVPGPVYADDDEAAEEPPPLPPRREVPDLDGRPEVHDDALEAALWIPRILTGPLYLLTEYVIRAPLNFLLTEAEQAGIIDLLFGASGDFTILPTLFFEFGLSPSAGLYAAWDHFLFDENRISMHAATWGEDWLRLIVRDRVQIDDRHTFALRFEARKRPDQLIEGIGYDATNVPRARFGVEQLEWRLEFEQSLFRRSEIEYQAGYRRVGFLESGWDGDPTVNQRGGEIPIGYDTGYELLYWRADFVLDTHDPRGELTRDRIRARVLVEQNAAFGGLTAQPGTPLFASWIHWGGELSASTDVFGRGRALMLRFRTELVSPLDEQQNIPFYELPDAGGKGPLPGFITGQLRGYSTIGLTLEYVWPVYALLDGVLRASVGNAFGVHYEDFELDRLRLGFGVGIVPRFGGEHLVEITAGFGTDTFENGTNVTQFRMVVGARHGL